MSSWSVPLDGKHPAPLPIRQLCADRCCLRCKGFSTPALIKCLVRPYLISQPCGDIAMRQNLLRQPTVAKSAVFGLHSPLQGRHCFI